MPEICTVTGTIYDGEGDPKENGLLIVKPVGAVGELIHTDSQKVLSGDGGEVSFDLIQGAQYNFKGKVLGFTGNGQNVTIPASGTANLEDLIALASVPTQGVTIKDEGVALSTLVGTFNFVGAGVAVTQPSAGVATVTISASGGIWGGITGTLSNQTDLQGALDAKLATNGNGSALTALNASALASGTIPDARFPATLPALSGANLTALNASALTSGTLPDARLSANIATKAYADALVVGLVDDRGNFDASGNVFPSSGGSGSAGAVLKGDLWTISVGGTLGGSPVTAGDLVRALTDTPGQTASNWAVTENNIGYVAENQANKATSFATLNNTLYPTTQAVANWAGSTNLTTLGTVTTGTLGSGAVLAGVTMTLGSDATGDIYYRNASGILTRLPVGTNGHVLTLASGLPSWAAASGGGTTINATNGVLPYRSDATTFLDSPFSVAGGKAIVTSTLATSGVAPYFRIITPADTGQTADTEFPGIVFGGNASGATVTRTGADGTTYALQREYVFTHPTYAFAGATTVTIAATVSITGAPVAGSNATLTNAYALYVAAGNSRFNGTITCPGAGSSSERFGGSSAAAGAFATALGPSASAGSDQSVAIGFSSTVQGADDGAIVIGASSSLAPSTNASIVIGQSAGAGTGTNNAANTIQIGKGSVAPTANTMVVGSSGFPINVFYGGKGERHATPTVWAVSGTHGFGANINGGDIVVQPGFGTGTGVSGSFIVYCALASASSSVRNSAVEAFRINSVGVPVFPATMTAGGTTGNQTIDKVSGSVNFAAAATSLTVTNNKVEPDSIVLCQVLTNDATMKSVAVVVSDGSFVIHANAAPTGETKVAWLVLNQ